MNYRDRDVAATFTGVAIFALLGAAVAVVVFLVPVAFSIVSAVGRLQVQLIERAVAGFGSLTGWQFDGENLGVKLTAAACLFAGVTTLIFLVALVGRNLGTLLLLAGGSAVIGMLLTLAGGVSEHTDTDYLGTLKFWG